MYKVPFARSELEALLVSIRTGEMKALSSSLSVQLLETLTSVTLDCIFRNVCNHVYQANLCVCLRFYLHIHI